MTDAVRLKCSACPREYTLNNGRGHSLKLCNSCSANRYRIGFKQRCVDYLGGRCKRCGYDKCLNALQAHHRDPQTKAFEISSGSNRKWALVQAELDKCDLLCSNCHAEVHTDERWQLLYKMRPALPERSRVNWPTKQKLSAMVARAPLTTIAKQLGVSDAAVKKRCKKLGIETKGRGQWGHNGFNTAGTQGEGHPS